MKKTGFPQEMDGFYDACYSRKNDYKLRPDQSRFYKMWKFILDKIIKDKTTILDIGCGTGQFGMMAKKRGHTYIGLDFSKIAIKRAKLKVKGCKFYCRDIVKNKNAITNGRYDVVTFIEFLEHIDNDLGIIRAVPRYKRIIATFPNFGGKPHVRYFKTLREVRERYGFLINIQYMHWVDKKHMVIDGYRNNTKPWRRKKK